MIEIAFIYREDNNSYSIPPLRKFEKRGRVSITSRILAKYKAYIIAEEEVTR